MKHFVKSVMPAVVALIMSLTATAAKIAPAAVNSQPDFAFPEKVSATALKDLGVALKKHDNAATVRSLIEYYLAITVKNPDETQMGIDKILSVIDKSDDPALRAMLNALVANIYNQAYKSNRGQYDFRKMPLTPRNTDFRKWSGEQFKACITEYLEASLADSDVLKSVSLREYADVITTDEVTFIYYPTLYDFIAGNAITIYKKLNKVVNRISNKYFAPYDMFTVMKFDTTWPVTNRILALYSSLISFHLTDTPALINADLERLGYVYWMTSDDFSGYNTALKDLYYRFVDSEYSGNILLKCNEHMLINALEDNEPELKSLMWFYDAIKSNLLRFPSYYFAGCLEQKLAMMNEKRISITCNEFVRPGTEVKITASVINSKDVMIEVYKFPNFDPNKTDLRRFILSEVKKLKPIKTFSAVLTDSIPFYKDITFKYTFPDDGLYVVLPKMNNPDDENLSVWDVITVSKLALLNTSWGDSRNIYALDPLDSSPVAGAEIFLHSSLLGYTDASGLLKIDNATDYGTFYAKFGDSFAESRMSNSYIKGEPYTLAEILTDLAIYHPGDTVKLTAVVYESALSGFSLKTNTRIKAKIRTQTGETDTIVSMTDSWGRAQMTYVIPENSLTGQYSVWLSEPKASGAENFMVSDYKMASFEIKLDTPQINIPAHGEATVSGQVMTYSGFPLAQSAVTVSLKYVLRSNYFPWFTPKGFKVYGAEVTTDQSGRFEVVIPDSIFRSVPDKGCIYVADVQATSPAGESHSAYTNFTFTEFNAIKIGKIDRNINASEPLKIKASVIDFNGNEIDRQLRLTLVGAHSDSISLPIPPDRLINLSDVKSGYYDLTITCPDGNDVTPYSTKVVIYRPSDMDTPMPKRFIWTPDEKFDLGSDRRLTWLFASNCPTRLLVMINSDKLLFEKWIDVNKGMNRFHWQMPDSVTWAVMSVAGFGNCVSYKHTFNITAPEKLMKLKIKAESFRDKVMPGQNETWTFSIVDSDNHPKEAAVLMEMYNKALDAISSHSFSITPMYEPWLPKPDLSLSNDEAYNKFFSSLHVYTTVGKECNSQITPSFDTFGLSLFTNSRIMIRGYAASAKYSANKAVTAKADYTEEEEDDDDDMGEDMAYNSAAGMKETSVATDDLAINGMKVIGYGTVKYDGETSKDDFNYRQSEVPLAFYAPDLTTDSEGRLAFSFKVPDANTLWNFNAIAYTDRLLTASFNADVLASKPVMVKPNLPRYIRTGDCAAVVATVMNNTPSAASIETTVEIFNPANNSVITSRRFENNLDSMQSVSVSVNIEGAEGMPFIGYRVKSSTDSFADGEQSLIPVLASQTPLIESKPFYIAPDEKQFSMSIPEFGKDARLTLQYCENPVWFVVTALPGLLKSDASTANQAAAAIFSASVARGLIDQNPEIEKALKEWIASEKSDSTLTSMLSRNSDLKMVLLNATPWMMDAAGDSERMSRLALLFDRKEINRVITTNVDILERLQRDGGGWAWIEGMDKASEWSTMNALLMFGHLNRLGFMPDNKSLVNGIKAALSYIDTVTSKDFAKYPKGDYRFYTYVRSFYPDKDVTTDVKSVISTTVNNIIRSWKKQTVYNKAIDAIILKRNSYPAVARNILSSLDEYSVYNPEKGMYWPSLENQTFGSMGKIGSTAIILNAYREVDPQSISIERITQWLVLQKEAMDWGNSVATTQIISSILDSSHKWLRPARAAEVKIDGEEVVAETVEKVTGAFSTDVTGQGRPGSVLEITRTSDTPAWGALVAQFNADLTDVKAASVKDLSIEKRLLRYTVSAGSPAVESADDLAVGDKVRVELTVTAGRDMDYVAIIDERAAGFEPVEQLPKPIYNEGIFFYRENRDSESRIFVTHLPKGTYILTYDVWVNNAGNFTTGVAKIQSQYTPALTAHSSSRTLHINP